jgi:cell division protease FtsH
MALGVTQTLPEKEMLNITRKKAISMISFLFGGRAAEEIVFDDFTTGAGNDIERATELARSMVCEWGMSDKLGPISLEKKEGPVFLGMQKNQRREHSESKAREIDEEIDVLIREGYEVAKKILIENRVILDEMSKALMELESISGEEVSLLIKGHKVEELIEKRKIVKSKLDEENERARLSAEQKEKADKKKVPEGSGPVGNTGPVTA